MKQLRINFLDELKNEKIVQLRNIENAYYFEDSTPAHQFYNVIAGVDNADFLALTVATDYFDQELATSIVQFVRAKHNDINLSRPWDVIHSFGFRHYMFDSMLILGPELHGQFEDAIDLIYQNSIAAFPIHHSEFCRGDSPDLIDMVRSRFVNTLDWMRAPSPRVWMRFQNSVTRSNGKKLGLIKSDTALMEIHRIKVGNYGWAEIKNYLGEAFKLTCSEDAYIVELPDETLQLKEADFDEWYHKFLLLGMVEACKKV